MDIGRSINAITQDPNWVKKLLLGGLFLLLFVTIPAVVGYYLRYVKNVVEGRDAELPEWDDFGQLWVSGLILIVIAIIWAIPGAILGRVPSCVGPILNLLWSICMAAAFCYITVRYALTQNFGTAFEFTEILGYVQNNLGNVVMAMLLGWVFWIMSMFGLIGLIIGVCWTAFFAMLATGNLYGQAWRLYYQTPAPAAVDFFPAHTASDVGFDYRISPAGLPVISFSDGRGHDR